MRLRRIVLCTLAGTLAWSLSASARPAPQAVAFRSPDGVILQGRLWPAGPVAVVFSHMFGRTQTEWADLAGHLAARGYTALTFDFRGVGSSSGRLVIRHVYRDTLAAAAFMRARRYRTVVLIGASMGGTSSIVAAGHAPVEGLVVIASGTVFQGLDARPHLSRLRMPKLFIVGDGDPRFNHSARIMYEATPQPKQLIALPTSLHGTYMFRSAAHRERIYGAIASFLRTVTE